ncbi:MAG: hypothetical protein A2Y10_00220 [Planctomycetes bacterium GWF2_41_51]|nr:MAG: hypothetical protein A2Y10_00220 [Planctomycetes bacterium GWF2_41_51]HBG27105.1 hypothetical protein [Phycisphaerales bacterium]
MKKICFFTLLALIAGGCQISNTLKNDKDIAKTFPKSLAAVWEGYFSEIHWVIKFSPEGTIEFAKPPFVGEFVGENSEAIFPMQGDNNTMIVKTGDFLVDYKSDGTLNVSLEIINCDAMTPVGRMEMRGTEYLLGKVDLEKGIWDATWITDGTYWITPLGDERTELPKDEEDGGNEITLKRMIRKDDPNAPSK